MPGLFETSSSSSVQQYEPTTAPTGTLTGNTRPIFVTHSPFVGNRNQAGSNNKYNGGKLPESSRKPFAGEFQMPPASRIGEGKYNDPGPTQDTTHGLGGSFNSTFGNFGNVLTDLTGSIGSAAYNIIDYVFNISNTTQYSPQTTSVTGGSGSGSVNASPSLAPVQSAATGESGLSTTTWLAIIGAVLALLYFFKK